MTHNIDIATQAHGVIVKALYNRTTTTEKLAFKNLPKSTIRDIDIRAIERGFNPHQRPLDILDWYLEDGPPAAAQLKVQKR